MNSPFRTLGDPKLIMAAIIVLFVAGMAGAATALDCLWATNQHLVLELESVELDGEPQQDTSRYDDLEIELSATYHTEHELQLTTASSNSVEVLTSTPLTAKEASDE